MAPGQCRPCQPRSVEGDVGDRELPHGRARRPCRALREVRAQPDLVQLLPQPALPEVPGRGGKGLAGGARSRSAAGAVLSCGVHTTWSDRRYRLPEQGRYLRPTVQDLGRDPDHDRGRPKAPRRPRRHHLGSPYLGLGHDPSPARPHDRAGRRHLARRRALGGVPARLLPAGARALAPVPPTVPGEAARNPSGRPPEVLRRSCRSRRRAGVRDLAGVATPSRMGGLCQASVRRPTGRAGLSVALYPPRRH